MQIAIFHFPLFTRCLDQSSAARSDANTEGAAAHREAAIDAESSAVRYGHRGEIAAWKASKIAKLHFVSAAHA